jgi:hypothetical protein
MGKKVADAKAGTYSGAKPSRCANHHCRELFENITKLELAGWWSQF